MRPRVNFENQVSRACGMQKTPLRWQAVSGVSPPSPAKRLFHRSSISCEGRKMGKKSLAGLAVAVLLSLSLTACKDTKTLQENEQLKAQIAQLQKENGQLGDTLQTMTAS